jgi:hypothetical protein
MDTCTFYTQSRSQDYTCLESLDRVIQLFKKTIKQDGCSIVDIYETLNPRQRPYSQQGKPAGVTTVCFMQGTSGRISRLLARFSCAHSSQIECTAVEASERCPCPQRPKHILHAL